MTDNDSEESNMGAIMTLNIANVSIGLIFFILTVRFSASYFSYALAVFILFLIYDFYISRKEKKPFLELQKEIIALALSIIIFFGLLVVDSLVLQDRGSINKVFWVEWLSIPLLMTWWIRRKYAVDLGVEIGILAGMIVACGFGFWQAMHPLEPNMRSLSFYAHPNHFGTMINLTLPFLFTFALKEKRQWLKIMEILVVAVQMGCLYLAGSRGAMAAFGLSVPLATVLGLIMMRDRITPLTKKIAIAAIVLSIAVGGAFFYVRQQEVSGTQEIGGERIQMAIASVEMWKDHKVWGVGMSRWKDNYYGEYHPADGKEVGLSMPHNMPLYFLSTAGLVGFAGYVLFVGVTFWALLSIGRKSDDFFFFTAVMIAFLTFFAQGFVDTTIINKIPARMYYGILGYYIAAGGRCLLRGRNAEAKET